MNRQFCDVCKKELDKGYYSVELPRLVRRKIRGGKSNAVLNTFNTIRCVKTDLCPECQLRLAMALPVIEDD